MAKKPKPHLGELICDAVDMSDNLIDVVATYPRMIEEVKISQGIVQSLCEELEEAKKLIKRCRRAFAHTTKKEYRWKVSAETDDWLKRWEVDRKKKKGAKKR